MNLTPEPALGAGPTDTQHRPLVLVTGASGYVGGRLVPALETMGVRVRCMARNPQYVESRVGPETEVVRGDVLDPASLTAAMRDVETAYYLVHSLGSGSEFESEESASARNFVDAARAAGVRRIIYLGGLGSDEANLSPHLRSRREVGRILRESGVETIELRASIVIGSGSLSFEMIRALVERLPAMITPRWVSVIAQPIAIDDLIQYLLMSLDLPLAGSRVFEVGGSDRVSYKEMMREYASQRGLARMMIPVPLLTPRLSSLWLGLVTPVYARIGRKLIDSITNPTVVTDDSALSVFGLRPMGMREAIATALRNEDREYALTRWFDAVSSAGPVKSWAGVRFGNRILDAQSREVPVPARQAFAPIARIGGENGWYAFDGLWRFRGFVDLLLGGVGMRRGRPDVSRMHPGSAIDFWRVERFEDGHVLRLSAEMKVPGRAWLEFEVVPQGDHSTIRQTAMFDPIGLSGLLYWYLLYPVHRLIFDGMLDAIARDAIKGARTPNDIPPQARRTA